MRLTYKKLVQLVNEAFERVEADMEAVEAGNPRFRGHELEGGAPHIIVKCKTKGDDNPFNYYYLPCFCWSRRQLECEINKGAVIGFGFKDKFNLWSQAEIKPIYLK